MHTINRHFKNLLKITHIGQVIKGPIFHTFKFLIPASEDEIKVLPPAAITILALMSGAFLWFVAYKIYKKEHTLLPTSTSDLGSSAVISNEQHATPDSSTNPATTTRVTIHVTTAHVSTAHVTTRVTAHVLDSPPSYDDITRSICGKYRVPSYEETIANSNSVTRNE